MALLGIAVRTRRDYTEALVERAHRLEHERDQQARLAAAAERARIAREMHDIIGHNLSVITGLADGGAYAAARSPERAAQALEAIGTTSRQALSELRRLLGVLRDDHPDADRAPQPTMDDLAPLIEQVRRAGLPVHLELRGEPGPHHPGPPTDRLPGGPGVPHQHPQARIRPRRCAPVRSGDPHLHPHARRRLHHGHGHEHSHQVRHRHPLRSR